MNVAALLAEFHNALGQRFGHGEVDDCTLRIRLHMEEARELVKALQEGDLVDVAQELADVIYLAYGTAHILGIPLGAVIAEVHRANMSKFGPNGRPILDRHGKVLKGPHYSPPDIETAISSAECSHR